MTINWDPFKDLVSLQQRMNVLFEDTLARSRGYGNSLPTGTWSPAVDIFETEDTVIIQAELPGVSRETISVEVKDNTLSIRGERRFDKRAHQENVHRMERSYGPFQRSFTLPNTVHHDEIQARFQEGILEIIIPKTAKSTTRSIQVDVK